MRLVLPALLCLVTAGCAPHWEASDSGLRTVAVSDFEGLFDADTKQSALPFGVRGAVGEGRWKALPATRMEPVGFSDTPPRPEPEPEPEASPAPTVSDHKPGRAPPPAPRLPVPTRRTRKAKPTKAERDPVKLARERFIEHPTLVRAESVTLFCPVFYRPQIRLRGGMVESEAGGVRRATGDARLVLRELTIQADEIIVRPAKAEDVQILARGDAGIVSRLGKRVIREEGLRSLIVRNDRTVPIR